MKRLKKLAAPVILSSVILSVSVFGAEKAETTGGTIEYSTKKTDIVTITISKEYMDLCQEVYNEPFDTVLETFQSGDDDEVLDLLKIREIEDYGVTDDGNLYFALTEEMYENFQQEWREMVVSAIQFGTMASGYYMFVYTNEDLTKIRIRMAEEDYQALTAENGKKLLYSIRAAADVYHALMGTSGDQVSVEFTDIETQEVLDDADWYDWREKMAELQ